MDVNHIIICVYLHVCISMYMCEYACMRICICMYICVYLIMYMYEYACVCLYIYIYIYVCVYVCIFFQRTFSKRSQASASLQHISVPVPLGICRPSHIKIVGLGSLGVWHIVGGEDLKQSVLQVIFWRWV